MFLTVFSVCSPNHFFYIFPSTKKAVPVAIGITIILKQVTDNVAESGIVTLTKKVYTAFNVVNDVFFCFLRVTLAFEC